MTNRFLILSLLFVLNFCSKSEDIDKQTAAKVYVEFLIINETYPVGSDSIEIKKNLILKEFDLTLDEYNRRISELKDDKEEWMDFFHLSEEYLKEKKDKLTSEKNGS